MKVKKYLVDNGGFVSRQRLGIHIQLRKGESPSSGLAYDETDLASMGNCSVDKCMRSRYQLVLDVLKAVVEGQACAVAGCW